MRRRVTAPIGMTVLFLALVGCTVPPTPAVTVTAPAPTVTVEAAPSAVAPLTPQQAWTICASAGLGILYDYQERERDLNKDEDDEDGEDDWLDEDEHDNLDPASDYTTAAPMRDSSVESLTDGVYKTIVYIPSKTGLDAYVDCDVSGSMADPRVSVRWRQFIAGD